jgi:hypothetical protein
MRKPKAVIFAEELEGQDSPLLAVLKHYGAPLSREEFIGLNYLGEVDPDEEIPEDCRGDLPRAISTQDTDRNAARVGESSVG